MSRIIATPRAFFALNKNLDLMEKLEGTLKTKGTINYGLLEEHGFGCFEFGRGGVGLWIELPTNADKKLFKASYQKLFEEDTLSDTRPTVKSKYQIAFLNLCGIDTEGINQDNLGAVLERIEQHRPKLNGMHRIRSGKIFYDRLRPHTLIIADPRPKK